MTYSNRYPCIHGLWLYIIIKYLYYYFLFLSSSSVCVLFFSTKKNDVNTARAMANKEGLEAKNANIKLNYNDITININSSSSACELR